MPLIVVLGASGYLGTAVMQEFSRLPVRIRAVARRECAPPSDALAQIEVCAADLTVPGALADAVHDADVVIHLVAYLPGVTSWRVADADPLAERVNVGLMRDLVEILRASRRARPVVVFAGTTSQVGTPPCSRIDGSEPDDPVTAYDRQKQAAEQVLKAATAEGLLTGISLRLATVFGDTGEPSVSDRGVVTAMIRRSLAGQALTMWHDGMVERDLLHVRDCARAFTAAVDHASALAGRHWLVGTGRPVKIADLFHAVAAEVSAYNGNPAVPVVSSPAPEQARATDFHSFAIDSSAFTAVTGWRPELSLAGTLGATVAAVAEKELAWRGQTT